MSMTRLMMIGVLVTVVATAGSVGMARAEEPATTDAVAAARSWLALVDAGDYGSSWDEAAGLFKAAVSKEQWQQSLAAVRTPLGEVLSREVSSATYRTSLPGAPDGEYVVVLLSTSFSKKKSAVETVTPKKEADGTWRVSGYYIK